ncbi:histone-lysine N-methyltransferase SETDB1-A-like [Engraulis encrasicolus]|uniref:histone-lysine N-methyltransferase SETDB1-A-like n=1 Tax=Engraulis encrasicolus TaxID=184585 RepID=UPI002FD7305C
MNGPSDGGKSQAEQPPLPLPELRVSMRVLGRRKTKTWHEGTLTEIRDKDGCSRYKVDFGEEGSMLLPGQHVALLGPTSIKHLKMGTRVAASVQERDQQPEILSGTLAELPDRKNRARFLLFLDDGKVRYVGLQAIHLVYKPSENVGEDIEDEAMREFVLSTLLQGKLPTIRLMYKQGESLKVERDEEWAEATITEVDCSLVKVKFKNDGYSEWMHKGSERLHYVFRSKQQTSGTDKDKQKGDDTMEKKQREREKEKEKKEREEFDKWLESVAMANSDVRQRQAAIEDLEAKIQKREDCFYININRTSKSLLECESVIKGFYNQLDMDYRDTDSEDEDLGKQQRDSAIPLDVEDEDEEDNGNYRLDNNEDMDIDEPSTSSLPHAKLSHGETVQPTSKELSGESSRSDKARSRLRKPKPSTPTAPTPETLPYGEVPSPSLPTAPSAPLDKRTSPSEASKPPDPHVITKLKNFLQKPNSPQSSPARKSAGRGASKSSKVSTPSSKAKKTASTPASTSPSSTPKDSNKTSLNKTSSSSTPKTQKSILGFLSEPHSPTVPNGVPKHRKRSGPTNSENLESSSAKEICQTDSPKTPASTGLANLAVLVSGRDLSSKAQTETLSTNKQTQPSAPTSTNKPTQPSDRTSTNKQTQPSAPTSANKQAQPPTPTTTTTTTSTNSAGEKPNASTEPEKTRGAYKPLSLSEVWGVDEDEVRRTPSPAATQVPKPTAANDATNSGAVAKPAQTLQKEAAAKPKPVKPLPELKENMKVLGRRRTKTWHEGTLVEIRTTEGGTSKYKIHFGEKGKMLLSGHHVAFFSTPSLDHLSVGCRVAATYTDGLNTWIMSASLAELPDRKNKMRFLMFYDDGNVEYVTLPDMHLIYKPLDNVGADIEDEGVRKFVLSTLHSGYTPTILVLHKEEALKVERHGVWADAVITEVDCSLVKVKFKSDDHSEKLYKGSERLHYVYKMKQRALEAKRKDSPVQRTETPSRLPPKPQTNHPSALPTTTNSTQATTTSTSNTSNRTTSTTNNNSGTKQTTTTTTTTTSNRTPTPTPTPTPTTTSNRTPTPTPTPTTTIPSKSISSPQVAPPAISETERLIQEIKSNRRRVKVVIHNMDPSEIMHLSSTSWDSAYSTASSAAPSPPPLTLENHSLAPITIGHGTKRPLPSESETLGSWLGGRTYGPHRCCPSCLDAHRPTSLNPHLGKNPLQIPQLFGFRRITGRYRVDHRVLFHVFYRSPCGRCLNSMEQVQYFLLSTHCDFLSLDMFSMDPYVLVKRAKPPGQQQLFFSVPDISNGVESVPIPCINQVDNTIPQFANYITQRRPVKGVHINTQTNFLVGCDCTDGCLDRSKCSCHQLTVDATELFPGGPVDCTAGYSYKRLPKALDTGVYECNPLCRCDPRMCGNRVVQHGPQLRLQMFMTQHKGWGIHCQDDVSKGTFVCCFAGNVVSDDIANAEGKVTGDEYFANLDFIEGVEKLKEGYESSAYCSDSEGTSTSPVQPTADSTTGGDFQMSDDDDSEDDDDSSDADFEGLLSDDDDDDGSSDGSVVAYDVDDNNTIQRDYITRRNAKILQVSVTDKSPRKTRCFAVKSSHRKVKKSEGPKPESKQNSAKPESKQNSAKPEPKQDSTTRGSSTRKLFDGEESCYIIDARQHGNLGRYINHSCDPNLFVQNVFVDTHDLRFPWVAFFTSKRVKAGTELTWDYNYEVGSVEGKLLLCCCGSERCTGRLL